MTTKCLQLKEWVEETARLTQPDKIHWCDGSEAEYDAIVQAMLEGGELISLNATTHPRCFLHRSDPNDVARTEHLTFVCTKDRETSGPNNNWMSPEQGHARAKQLFAGAMRGRTMYVVPYCMGPISSPFARCGVEITDSPYVVANMRIMTRMGTEALAKIERDGDYVKALHSLGDLSVENRLILHFPEELAIKSIGSGYGGNALLGKKCHALRVASFQGQKEGWLAEHMLIAGIESPEGEIHYIAAAFPSACGKTNLAMLIPPKEFAGWKIWTVGDDIAWLHRGEDGYLYAINPEAGFFGVAPGTSTRTNPNALSMLKEDAIFTNVALTADEQPWWEGLDSRTPTLDWRGDNYSSAKSQGPAAHPNSRFTVSARQCPSYSKAAENPQGVRISAIVFGGRRSDTVPIVYEAKSWAHGVMVGAAMASQTTAAATGKVGLLRRDPMAMKPFCGYNFGDYWQHWLSFGGQSAKLPKIFHVNWFRTDAQGNFMWPGYGENIRVLEWILGRVTGRSKAVDTPIGLVPGADAIRTDGIAVKDETMRELCAINPAAWVEEMNEFGEFLNSFGERVPKELLRQQRAIVEQLESL